MRDHTEAPATPTDPSPATVLLRRAAAVAGFLFGLGLLALLGAGQAGADERPAEVSPANAPALDLVDDVAAPVLAPVATITEPVVAPVVRPVAEAVAPVVRTLTEAVAPVVRPVLAPVTPVLQPVVRVVAPVAAPLAGPLLRAADPVVSPVAASVGADDAVADLSEPRAAAPPRPSRPAVPPARQVPVADAAGTVSGGSAVVSWSPGATASTSDATAVALPAGPGRPGDRPGFPLGTDAVPGGAAAGGSGGQHGADGTVSSPRLSSGVDGPGDRAPPGGDVSLSWLAFEDHDHPS